ncbi:MAG: helix-turn-helix transcriptional regulator [Vibrio sp.]
MSMHSNVLHQFDSVRVAPFTSQDRDILASYQSTVEGLANLIGPYCEIVLHSLDDLNSSTIQIAHGENTGRQIGAPITDLALKMLRDIQGSHSNFSKPIFTRSKNGVLMKSMTIAIRNRQARIIGLLCVNINLDAPFSDIIQAFIPSNEVRQAASQVNFATDVEALVDQTLEHTIEEVNADKTLSNHMKNRQIVIDLYDKGIFDIKDAIHRVAERLNISKHTVYLYIRQRKGEE